jgi:hypothetical protein
MNEASVFSFSNCVFEQDFVFVEETVSDISIKSIDENFQEKLSFDELLEKIEKENFNKTSGLVYTYEDCKILKKSLQECKSIKVINENKIAIIDYIEFLESSKNNNKKIENLKRGNKSVSKKSVIQAIENLFLIADYKMKQSTAKKFNFNYRCVFITLTAKREYEIQEFEKSMWKAWRIFYESLRKKYKFSYVLVKERHRSGYCHYHVIADLKYIKVEKLNELWVKCLKKNNLSGDKNSLDLKVLKEYLNKKNSYRAVIKYITKYVSKCFESEDDSSGMRATWTKNLSKRVKIEKNEENIDSIINNAKKINKLQIDDLIIKSVVIVEIDVRKFFKKEIENFKNKIYEKHRKTKIK